MNLSQSIIDTMRRRQSVRSYHPRNITDVDYKRINEYINNEDNLIGPFGTKGKIKLIQVTKNVSEKGIKLGTYGFIKEPKAYLIGITENQTYSLVEYAYTFHKIVLFLTDLEMGTCWMGGTFNRNSFEKEIQLEEGEFIPCITPLGYPSDKQRVFDKALRFVVKADNKKSWDKLFYDTSFAVPLAKEQSGLFEIPIEMVRLGPSASNKQPWRLILSSDRRYCHFFIEHTPNYSRSLGYDMQLLDMGIAMCQFALACLELKVQGSWIVENPTIDIPNEHTEYVVSWKLD
jgi:hypothetical protein